ncbi:MAG TPA: hypothetical protein VNG33_16210, partial [Polyangiaceae bacterium]|nr:hypothetical protein [Polyangiaceae bacterium]
HFHVFRLRAEGVRFLMRHKVHEAKGREQRLAAFPRIAGFSDPPLYRGPEPPPIPDDQYDLWQVHIEDVVAHAKELWFLEYRFQGEAEARGAFLVQPARVVQVGPARLDLRSGTLSVGPHSVARAVKGTIDASVPYLDVPKTKGAAVFRQLSTRTQLQLLGGDLDFVNVYLDPVNVVTSGAATWSIDARLKGGVVQAGTNLAFDAHPLLVSLPSPGRPTLELSGATQARLQVTASAPDRFVFSAETARLELGRSGGKSIPKLAPPELTQLRVEAALAPVDITQPIALGAAHLSVPSLRVPNLFWFEPWLSGDGSIRVDGTGSAKLELACDAQQACELERLHADVSGARLAIDERSSEPFSAAFDATNVTLPSKSGTQLAGQARLEVSSARALLPLVTSLPIKDAISSVLALSRIQARLATRQIGDAYEVTLVEATSGKLTARGHLRLHRQSARGALLLSTELMNVGVKLEDGDTDVRLLVSNDWLKTAER